MEAKRNIGVLVMRLQTPHPTEGHMQLLNAVKAASDKAVIILGEAPVRLDPKDPMPAKLRKRLLQEQLPGFDVLVLNNTRSNEVWSRNLDALIEKNYPAADNDVTLYGSRDSFIPFYQGPNRTKLIAFETHLDVSASAVRKAIYDGEYEPKNWDDYAAGFIAGANSGYPTSYQAVDVAYIVMDSTKRGLDKYRVILGDRGTGTDLRFPGGFTDPKLDRGEEGTGYRMLEMAGCRELAEETEAKADYRQLDYLGSFRVDDWRFHGSVHKIGTALFAQVVDIRYFRDYKYQELRASDDLGGPFYANLAEVKIDAITTEHRPLFSVMLKYLFDREEREFQANYPDHSSNQS